MFYLSIHQLMALCCFHVLAMANNAAVDILLCGHMFSFLLGIHLGVELLTHMETLCLTIYLRNC